MHYKKTQMQRFSARVNGHNFTMDSARLHLLKVWTRSNLYCDGSDIKQRSKQHPVLGVFSSISFPLTCYLAGLTGSVKNALIPTRLAQGWSQYQDHDVVLAMLMEVFHQLGECVECLRIEGEVSVPFHVIDVIPLSILQKGDAE